MKNQNDLIISISVGVVAIIVAIVIFAGSPQPTKPADPTAVDTSQPKLPAGDVVYGNGSGGSGAGGGGVSKFGGGAGKFGPGRFGGGGGGR
jgi:hypothetical protein